ncbi:MAG: metallophosphoesterase family protein [Giesbergeria sp.]
MKVAIIADSHWEEAKRFEECKRLHAWIAEDAKRRGVDLVLHSGDLFEKQSNPRERLAAFSWVQAMAEIAPFVIVRGNHDAVDDLQALALLDSYHPIFVVEKYAVVEVAGALVACVAWPRKASLLAATGAESHGEGEELAAEALRNLFLGIGQELRDAEPGTPTMLLMHAMVRDSVTSTGQPLVGCELEVGLDDLALVGAGAYFLGHVHKGQSWNIAGAWCGYPGSPRRKDFGELEPKGYVVATFEGGVCVDVEFVEVPATPMVHVDDEWAADPDRGGEPGWLAGAHGLPASCAGCELRFRYRVANDQRVPARAAAEKWRAEWLAEGAISVQLEEVVHIEQRTRADAIAADATLEEKVAAYWKAKGFEPGERLSMLTDKLGQLKEAVHAA